MQIAHCTVNNTLDVYITGVFLHQVYATCCCPSKGQHRLDAKNPSSQKQKVSKSLKLGLPRTVPGFWDCLKVL